MENKTQDQVVVPSQLDGAGDDSRDEKLARLRKFEGLLPAGFRFDREEANTR
jgi:hypothetical protein